jgi:hypothetical protein
MINFGNARVIMQMVATTFESELSITPQRDFIAIIKEGIKKRPLQPGEIIKLLSTQFMPIPHIAIMKQETEGRLMQLEEITTLLSTYFVQLGEITQVLSNKFMPYTIIAVIKQKTEKRLL